MHDLSVFLLIALVTVLTPGAGVLFTVSTALRHGMRAPWQAPLGNAIGSTLIAVICAAGVGAVITSSELLYGGLRIVSALVLLWLGWRAWHAPTTGFASLVKTDAGMAEAPRVKSLSIIFSALVLQATNPVLYVFVLSLLPQFIDQKAAFVPQAGFLIGIFAATIIVVHLAYSLLAAWARRFLASARAAGIMNRISGGLFGLLGLSVLVQFAAGLAG